MRTIDPHSQPTLTEEAVIDAEADGDELIEVKKVWLLMPIRVWYRKHRHYLESVEGDSAFYRREIP